MSLDAVLPDREPGRRPLLLLIGAMAFLAALALLGGLALGASAGGLARQLGDSATIQIVEADAELAATEAERALALLTGDPAVVAARAVPRAETAQLLAPWLGGAADDPALPLPPAIEIRLAPGGDAKAVARRLAVVAPAARVDVHADWLAPVARFADALVAAAAVIVALTALATAAVVALGVRAGLDAWRPTIDVAHLLGAEDKALALLFQRRYLKAGLVAGLAGSAGAGLVAASLAAAIGVGALEGAARQWWPWAVLVGVPVAAGALAGLAARVSVRAALRAQP
ncbi:MAG: cell division protein [Alphaproteobacteria bacterium]|nr:cell division protein [Alphaproteobacteria bacterium]